MIDARYSPSRAELCQTALRLCKAFLGIEDVIEDVDHEWKRMVRLALAERDRMRIRPRRAPSEYARTAAWDVAEPHPIDNRMVWRLVLDGGGVPGDAADKTAQTAVPRSILNARSRGKPCTIGSLRGPCRTWRTPLDKERGNCIMIS